LPLVHPHIFCGHYEHFAGLRRNMLGRPREDSAFHNGGVAVHWSFHAERWHTEVVPRVDDEFKRGSIRVVHSEAGGPTIGLMQNILSVLCFIAGFGLAWLVYRKRREESETAFRAISADALARNNQTFLEMAQSLFARQGETARAELVRPVRESLDKVYARIQE